MDSLAFEPSAAAAGSTGWGPSSIRAPRTYSEATKVVVECVDFAALAACRSAWADLASRALDPNVFLGPGFALPLLQHVAERAGLRFLLVWEDCGPALFERLVGLFPLQVPRLPFQALPVRVFAHEQTACGTPLVDREHASEVFEALFRWLETSRRGSAALVLSNVARDAAFASALRRFCAETSRTIETLDAWERAVLPRLGDQTGSVASFGSAKRRKERARQSRRLSESGLRTYVTARTPAEVAAATERFLALEHKGWKGARGSSLLADPRRATFARTMTRLLADSGQCRIDAIQIDGRPVAMGIVLRERDNAFFWKTTFDEAYASLSPGVQLVIELSRLQQADPTLDVTDSCAIANHPMIDRLWPGRAAAADLMISVRPGRSGGFDRCRRLERWRRMARGRAKGLWQAASRLRGD